LASGTSAAVPLLRQAEVMNTTGASGPRPAPVAVDEKTSLCGCSTRDDEGNFYLVGRHINEPRVLQARPPRSAQDPAATAPAMVGGKSGTAAAASPAGPVRSVAVPPVEPETRAMQDSTEAAPEKGAATANPVERRLQFHRELRALVEAEGDDA